MLSYRELRESEEIRAYIMRADASLEALGYTEHRFAHVCKVADTTRYLLEATGSSPREAELGQIAGYLHDVGNLINRVDHSQSGAMMAFHLLEKRGMAPEEIAEVVTAIGNHDEGTGVPVSRIAAALILADKSDVRRSRVRNPEPAAFDIHDRVNFSVTSAAMTVDAEEKQLLLDLEIDTECGSVMDFFEIFLERMLLCRRASEALGLKFRLRINRLMME